jgi:hypothetical protein
MKKACNHPRPAARAARPWTPPKLRRFEAGRAEGLTGLNIDISDHS